MITPSALNVLIIGLSVMIFMFLVRMLAAKTADSPFGQALSVIV